MPRDETTGRERKTRRRGERLDTASLAAPVGFGGRVVPVDNLRAVLVAWVIAGHGLMGYATIGGWPYDEVQEVTLSPRLELGLSVVLGPTALFVIGSFFFLAGLFSADELARRGAGDFARRRIVRLGLPWMVFTLSIWPLFMWLAYRAAGHDLDLTRAYAARTPLLDSGPLWFVQVLLYVSLGYAVGLWRLASRQSTGRAVGARQLAVVTAAVAVATFLVRLEFPARSQQILDLHLWQWPQCLGMFWPGVLVGPQGWAMSVPRPVVRLCTRTLVATLASMPLLAVLGRVTNVARDDAPFLGGWHWQALTLAVVESLLVVTGSVCLLAAAQRLLTSETGLVGRNARASYLAYMLQVPALLGLAIVLRPLPLPAIVKGLSVGLGGLLLSFAVARAVKTALSSPVFTAGSSGRIRAQAAARR